MDCLTDHFRNNDLVQAAIAIYKAGKTAKSTEPATFTAKLQNWISFWQLLQSPNVTYLMACAAELAFNDVRQHILDTLRIVYRPKGNRQRAPDDWTLEKLVQVLGFDTGEQVKEFCGKYGFEFAINSVGAEYLDVSSRQPSGKLSRPPTLRPQFFSEHIVESKRRGRQPSAIIEGTFVHEAKSSGPVGSKPNCE